MIKGSTQSHSARQKEKFTSAEGCSYRPESDRQNTPGWEVHPDYILTQFPVPHEDWATLELTTLAASYCLG
jgi:hypothetical protein